MIHCCFQCVPLLPTYRWSLNTEFSSSTIFSSSSMSSLGRSADMKALTVTDTSSGLVVSFRAVCTTCEGDKERGEERREVEGVEEGEGGQGGRWRGAELSLTWSISCLR